MNDQEVCNHECFRLVDGGRQCRHCKMFNKNGEDTWFTVDPRMWKVANMLSQTERFLVVKLADVVQDLDEALSLLEYAWSQQTPDSSNVDVWKDILHFLQVHNKVPVDNG